MSKLDLNLMLDNTINDYSDIKTIYNELQNKNLADNIKIYGKTLQATIENSLDNPINLSDEAWNRFYKLYEIEGGVATLLKYKGKPYADIIYNRQKKSDAINKLSKADICRYKIAGGSPAIFEALQKESDSDIIEVYAGSILEDEVVNGMETFFEQFDSKNSLLRSKLGNVAKWRNVESYDEFLQVPILKEGKDFMNKFLDIERSIEAGGDVSLEEVENLMPDYLVGGANNLNLLNAVDPKYNKSSYILSNDITDYTKALIDNSFLQCFSIVRSTSLADLKSILERINIIVKMITKQSKRLINPQV